MGFLKKLKGILAGLGLLILGCSAHVEADSVGLQVDLDHDVVLMGKKQPIYVLLDFDVAEAKQDSGRARPSINLALVLDRSGSMEDRGKMAYAKEAARIVVDNLTPDDRLAVVEYDDQINVLWPSSPVEAPDMIKSRIADLYPRGSTNLTGGMVKGAEEVLANRDANGINRVLLLSDGLANEGITHPGEIGRLVREKKQKGVSISTMGLGLDYNEDLMQAVAEHGGGHYYFIEHPRQMSRIFRQEMDLLFATVAKDARVDFEGTDAVQQIDVFGFPAEIEDHRAHISMEDFYSGEKRSLLLRLEIEPQKEGQVKLGQVVFFYVDYQDDQPRRLASDLNVTVSSDIQKAEASRNDRVMVEATLIESDRRHEEYVRLYEQGNRQAAESNLSKLGDEIGELYASLQDVRLSKKLDAIRMEAEEMEQAEVSGASRAGYLKRSKQRAYYAQKGQRGKYLLQEGDTGYDVERVQKALKDLNLYAGPVDGRFSPEVTTAVKELQRQHNLTADGVVGPRTMKILNLY